jgi:hypothetical protein
MRSAFIIGITTVVFVGLILAWAFAPSDRTLTASATEITDKPTIEKHVELSHIGIETSENYVGHHIRIIHGTIKNISDKPLRMVEVKMVFKDYDGKSIQENVEKAHELTQKPLAPGMQRRFEVNFENLPKTWDYHVPTIEITKIAN